MARGSHAPTEPLYATPFYAIRHSTQGYSGTTDAICRNLLHSFQLLQPDLATCIGIKKLAYTSYKDCCLRVSHSTFCSFVFSSTIQDMSKNKHYYNKIMPCVIFMYITFFTCHLVRLEIIGSKVYRLTLIFPVKMPKLWKISQHVSRELAFDSYHIYLGFCFWFYLLQGTLSLGFLVHQKWIFCF